MCIILTKTSTKLCVYTHHKGNVGTCTLHAITFIRKYYPLILLLSLALLMNYTIGAGKYFPPLSDVLNYTSNVWLRGVQLAVRCTLIYFVISFSKIIAMFWKVHAILNKNN